jgi:hypothetical protein
MTYHCEHCNKNVVFTTSSLVERLKMINSFYDDVLSICNNQVNKKRKRDVYENMHKKSNIIKTFVYKKMKTA